MFEHKRRAAAAFALAASFMMVLCAFASVAPGSDATGADLDTDLYGNVNEINIAPNYSWTYTLKFPADLADSQLEVTAEINELGASCISFGQFSDETYNEDGVDYKKISMTVSGITDDYSGKYNVVLKAYHEKSDQTKYQWIRIVVNDPLNITTAEVLESIILGSEKIIELTSEGGIGAVKWEASSVPDGMLLDADAKTISGTPKTAGEKTIQVKATSIISGSTGEVTGQTATLDVKFTVYDVIVGGESETINATPAMKNPSTAIVQTGITDLGVTWEDISGNVESNGFTLDSSTGVVSGTYNGSEPKVITITLKGTSANGPAQTADKSITINAEPAFTIDGGSSILNYTKNTGSTELQLSIVASTSDVTWSITEMTGVSIDQTGKVVLTGEAAVTEGTKATVTASTEYGQTQTKEITIQVEDTLKISGGSANLYTRNGISASTDAFTITGGSGNTVAVSVAGGDSIAASNFSFTDEKKLSVSYSGIGTATVTITVTSAAGQTATATVNAQVFSILSFEGEPSSDGIYAYVNPSKA